MSNTQQSRAGQSGLPLVSSAAYVRAVSLLGAALGVVSAVALARWSIDAKWWFFLALTVASSWATLCVPGMPISFSIADTFIFASALVFGPVAEVAD